MDKELLYQYMRVKFREAGFSRAEVELHMQSFAERYQNKTEDEIEADIRRRGGPSRVAAMTVERRNTVLMADPDYRAFAESNLRDADTVQQTESAVKEEPEAVAAPVPEETVSNQTEVSDDPLASWFAAAPEKEEQLPDAVSVFAGEGVTEPEQNTVTEAAAKADPSTAEIPTVRAEASRADTSPVAETSGTGSTKAEMPAAYASAAHSAPHNPSSAAQDLGRTRVMGVPTPERVRQVPTPTPVANHERRVPPVPTAQKRDGEAYRREQQAIWNNSNAIRDGQGSMQHTSQPAFSQTPRPAQPKPAAERRKQEYTDRGNVTRLQEKTWWGEGSEEGVKRFRIVMACAAPFAAVLLLAYAVFAVALIAGMALLSAVFILGLVVLVAVGSLIALVAVIYGVSQLFLVMPVGMFELGLGVAAIGITMFVGILMYNIAVRLLPFLIRSFIKFQSVFRGFIQDLYYYVKGECYRR